MLETFVDNKTKTNCPKTFLDKEKKPKTDLDKNEKKNKNVCGKIFRAKNGFANNFLQ